MRGLWLGGALAMAGVVVGMGLAHADEDLRLHGTAGGVEFWFSMNQPKVGCTYGKIKNTTGDRVEVDWGYRASSESGRSATVERTPDSGWILSPGQSVGGWTAILWCPFNKFVGDAPVTERMASLQVINIKVTNLSAKEREEEEAKRRAEEEKRRAEEEKRRAEEEKRRAEEEKRRAEEEKRRAEAERKRAEEDRKRAAAAKKKTRDDRRSREAERRRAEAERKRREAERRRAEEERKRREWEERGRRRVEQNEEWNRNVTNYGASMATAAAAMKPSAYKGASWRAAFVGGVGMAFMPVLENSTTSAYGASISSSDMSSGGGTSAFAGAELWPLFSTFLAFGGFGEAGAGSLAWAGGSGTMLWAHGGGKARFGSRRLALVGQYALGWRSASVSTDIYGFGATTTGYGTTSYTFDRFGGGLELCAWGDRSLGGYCVVLLRAQAFVERPHGLVMPTKEEVYVGRFDIDAMFIRLGVELGLGYPVSVEPLYMLDTRRPEGTYVNVGLGFAFDRFGDSYF